MKKAILLAEGRAESAGKLLRCLKRIGLNHSIHLARDGQEAMGFLFSQRSIASGEGQPVLVLLNLALPIVTGVEVLRMIRNNPRTDKIPVLAFAFSVSELEIHALVKLRANFFTEEPITFDKLVLVARQLGLFLDPRRDIFRRSAPGWPCTEESELNLV